MLDLNILTGSPVPFSLFVRFSLGITWNTILSNKVSPLGIVLPFSSTGLPSLSTINIIIDDALNSGRRSSETSSNIKSTTLFPFSAGTTRFCVS